MNIIAFDLGSNMAIAAHGVATTRVFTGNRETKLYEIMKWLEYWFDLHKDRQFDAVIYERPFARGQAATRMLWGIAGVIEAVSTKWGLPVVDVPPASIKKFAVGKGKATKEEMIDAAFLLGYTGDNEHEADAWCLLKYAEKYLEITPPKGNQNG